MRSVPSQQEYKLDASGLHSKYGHLLPTIIQDLLEITAQITVADRSTKRPRSERRGHQELRGWVRSFDLELSVRNPHLWSKRGVREIVEQLLVWLSEDEWKLEYRQLQNPTTEQLPLFSDEQNTDRVVLYSGGLDSLAGTITFLEDNPHVGVVLLSAVNDSLMGLLNRQVQEFQTQYPADDRVQFGRVSFERKAPNYSKEEETQRTRAFRFLAFSAAEAIAHGASEIVVCENGVGALNLPLNYRQLGAQHTRATHPKTLRLMTKLMGEIGFPQVRFTAPYLLRTKGELCKALRAPGLEQLMLQTVSCDSFPLRVKTPTPGLAAQCGVCTSCVLRRQSLYAAGVNNPLENSRYTRDIFRSPKPEERSVIEPLLMMLDQVTLIERASVSSSPVSALLTEFPDLIVAMHAIQEDPHAFGASPDDDIPRLLCDLLFRYAREWARFRSQIVVA